MTNKKRERVNGMTRYLAAALCGALLSGCLAGCGPMAAAGDSGPALTADAWNTPGKGAGAAEASAAFAEDGGEGREADPAERFSPYEPFGLRYDGEEDALWFGGERVRWFEDYYPLPEDGTQAGIDFFDAEGTVDVYAVRDRSRLVRRADGSYDPSGILTGVEAFSEEAFASRDVEALQNSVPPTAVAGDWEMTEEERRAIEESYAPFGVTYDAEEEQWYYNGEAVRYIRDILISNGESPTGGGFHGVIRSLASEGGSLCIETVRDYGKPDAEGYGTLTGVKVMEDPWFLESDA